MDYVIEKSTLSSTVGKLKKAFEKVARGNQPTNQQHEVAQQKPILAPTRSSST